MCVVSLETKKTKMDEKMFEDIPADEELLNCA